MSRIKKFLENLREEGEAARKVREARVKKEAGDQALGYKTYSDFVYFEYKANGTVFAVDSFEFPLPQRNEIVVLRPWGGFARMVVEITEVTDPDDLVPVPTLYVQGQIIKE